MANTYPTAQYPLGSTEVKVLYNNASNLDDAVNDQINLIWTDRFGAIRKTYHGIEVDAQNALLNTGYEFIGDYDADGPLTIDRLNQIFTKDGEFWRAAAPPPGPGPVLPYTTVNNWAIDQPKFVSAGDAVLRTDLAAPPGAGLIGFAGDGSVNYPAGTVGYALLRSLPAFVNASSYGFVGDGTNVDTMRLQAAIDSGFPICMNAGTFEVTLAQNIPLEGGASVCALIINTGMILKGAGKGKTIIKLKDNESTDASPKYFNIFAGNSIIQDAHFSDFTIDVNGANNKISPSRGSGVYNPYNCAGIFVSGRVATVGTDARMLNCSIMNMAFINSPGVTCIATGQQEGSAVLSNNVQIMFCDFYNNGIDSSDHSSVYMWGNKIWVQFCNFDHPSQSTGVAGPVVAAELHGSSNFFCNNNINNYCQIAWVSGNQTGPSIGMHVCNNHARVSWVGVGLYSLTTIALGLRDVIIHDNTIEILQGPILNPGMTFPKTGILLGVEDGQSDRVSVQGNVLKCFDVVSNMGILVAPGSAAFMQDTDVKGNMVSGFSRGIVVGLGATGTAFDTMISDNNICNLTPSTAVALPDGIHVTGAHGAMSIKGNKIAGSVINRGIFLSTFGGPSTLDSLDMDGNDVASNATTPIFDSMIVSGRRQGRQACTITTTVPTNATWRIGDEVYYAPNLMAFGGGGGTQYIVDGLRRMTNGTGNVLNVDWFQQRRLTGN
jgi:hypothetical protein